MNLSTSRYITLVLTVMLLATAGPLWAASRRSAGSKPATTTSKPKPTSASKPAHCDMVGPHGGLMVSSKEFKFELVVTDEHIKMYLFDLSGKPVSAGQVMGFFGIVETLTGKNIDSLILKSPQASSTTKAAKQDQDYLQVAYDPQELIAGRQLRFGLLNLPGKVQKGTSFTVDFQLYQRYLKARKVQKAKAVKKARCKDRGKATTKPTSQPGKPACPVRTRPACTR